MADRVTSQTIFDGDRSFVGKYTNISDGTGESVVRKVIVSALARNSSGRPCIGLRLLRIWPVVEGMSVRILWESGNPALCMAVAGGSQLMDFSSFGGIPDPGGLGATGNIAFTTNSASVTDSYVIVLECLKLYGP